jgi:Glycosyl hydrolases family 25
MNHPCCVDLYDGDEILGKTGDPLAGLDLVAAYGVPFLIHKASEGLTETDREYAARRAKWMSGPPVRLTDVDGSVIIVPRKFGAYHFFHGASTTSAIQEARHFKVTASLSSADEPFMDWETVGKSYEPTAEIADAFCQEIEQLLGRTCWVYGGNVPREQLESASDALLARFASRPIWFCEYGVYDPKKLPRAWQATGPILDQDDGDAYGPGPHRIPGVKTLCDNSTVVGSMTVAKLAAAWGAAPQTASALNTWQRLWQDLRSVA